MGAGSSGHHEAVPVRRPDAELFPSPRLPSQLLADFGTGVFGAAVVGLDVVDFKVGQVAVIADLGGRGVSGHRPSMIWMEPDRQKTQLPGSTSVASQARTWQYHSADTCRL